MLLFIMVSLSMQSQEKVKDTVKGTVKDTVKNKNIVKDNNKVKNSLNTNVITINLSAPTEKIKSIKSTEDGKRLTVRSRDFLQLELVGGNPFKYNYVIEKKLVNFFEDKDNNPFENIQKILNQPLVKDAKAIEDNDKKEAEKKRLEEEKQKEINKNNKLKKKNNESNTTAFNQKINELDRLIELNAYEPKALESLIILNKKLHDKNKKNEPTTEEDDKKNLNAALHSVQNKLDIFTTILTKFIILNKANDELDINKFVTEREKQYKKFTEIIEDYYVIKQDAAKFNDLGVEYEAVNSIVVTTLTTLLNEFKEMFALKTKNYFLPIDINGKNIDFVELSVKKFEKNNPVALEEHVYNVWIKGGFKIDISGGLFISSLINKEFVADNDLANPGKKIINERQKGDYEFGFGSMINISHRSAGWVNPTLNVGAMFTNTQQFQLLTGVGLILGKEERIIFGSGISMGRVTRLQGNLKVGDNNQDFGSSGTIPTSNVFAFGYYFGVTYNFSSKTKEAK